MKYTTPLYCAVYADTHEPVSGQITPLNSEARITARAAESFSGRKCIVLFVSDRRQTPR